MDHYRLVGTNGSGYSRKLRAILRYRRLPHVWELRTDRNIGEFAGVRPLLMPILQYPEDGSMHIDSTPIAYALEERHPNLRSIVPPDPVHAFLSHLIEDMGDEWLTKPLFHYRWSSDKDIRYASFWIADDFHPERTGEERSAAARQFAERQIARLPLVGCTPDNAPLIEESYRHVIAVLDTHVSAFSYLFGSRPALGDFGLFGQLATLASDPTPMAIMRSEAQRTESWVRTLDDASGIEGEWLEPGEEMPDATVRMVRYCGDLYLPFLEGNARAARAGHTEFTIELLGRPFSQSVFGYQVKCLEELCRRYQALDQAGRRRVDALLGQTEGRDVLRRAAA